MYVCVCRMCLLAWSTAQVSRGEEYICIHALLHARMPRGLAYSKLSCTYRRLRPAMCRLKRCMRKTCFCTEAVPHFFVL